MRRSITVLVVLLGMAGTGLAAAAPAASAASTTCLVVDTNADLSYGSLQGAVNAAAPGDTLFVKGTCTGETDIGTSLTITGHSNGGVKTATLNGGGARALLIEPGTSVTLNKLIITGGGFNGAGIYNRIGTVTLNDSTITGNNAQLLGGGIYNQDGGTVIMNGGSTIHGNTASFSGGGIYNECGGTLVGAVAGGNVHNNSPDDIFNEC